MAGDDEHLLECDFLVFDVAGMPEDPFCEDGLRVAEATVLDRFADSHAALAPDNRHLLDKFVRFVGQAFVSGLGVGGTSRAYADNSAAYIGVRFPWTESTLEIPHSRERRDELPYRQALGQGVPLRVPGPRHPHVRMTAHDSPGVPGPDDPRALRALAKT